MNIISGAGDTTREFDGPPEELSFRASGVLVNVKRGYLEQSFELYNNG